ncbi:PLT6 [Symbiodinium sp. CCMP2456]|nr:PLT6 [Symbiodinium sp. CCMP2456]
MERSQSAAAGRLLCYARLWGLMKLLETGLFQLVLGSESRGTFSFSARPLCELCGALGLSFWLFFASAKPEGPEGPGPKLPPSEPLLARKEAEASAASETWKFQEIFLPLLLLSQVLGLLGVLDSAPFAWDYQYAFALMELSLAAILALGIVLGRHSTFDARCAFVLDAARPLLCGQLGLLYLFAGVWKLNSTFLDPRVSCAPVLWAQLLAKYFYWLDYFGQVNVSLVKISIFGTLLVEIGLAVLVLVLTLALRLPQMQALTAWLPGLIFAVGLSLHLLIAICPSPNGAGGFSCAMAVWYAWLLPLRNNSTQTRSSSISSRTLAGAFLLALLALGLDMQDFAMPTYGVMVTILCAEFRHGGEESSIDVGNERRPRAGRGGDHIELTEHRAATLMTQLLFLLLFLAWSFGSAFVGIQDMGADTMYGGLQVYGTGRGNHLFLPTGVFWEAQHQLESGARPLLYRVSSVSQDSKAGQYLRSLYPAEVQLEPEGAATALLRSAGHTARMFSPGAARVLGPHWAEVARGPGPESEPYPYLAPEVALCRMVWEARAIMKRTAEEEQPGGLNTAPPLEIHVSPLDQGHAAVQPNLLILVTAGRVDVKCAKCISCEHVRERLQEVLRQPLPYWVWKLLVYFPIPTMGSLITSFDNDNETTMRPAGCVA